MRSLSVSALLTTLALAGGARGVEPGKAALLVEPSADPAAAAALGRTLLDERAPVERVEPPPTTEASGEALLADVRPLYAQMRFPAALQRVTAREEALIGAHLPDPARVRALAELLNWDGALRLLGGDAAAAADRFQLAARLAPGIGPDRLFPPEVAQAWRAAAQREAPPVQVSAHLAPPDARLWLDGKPVTPPVTAPAGLHYVVVERADLRPTGKLVRLGRDSADVVVHLSAPADAGTALRQASARLAEGPLGRAEAGGVASALGRPLWIVRARPGAWEAERVPPSGETRAPLALPPAPEAPSLAHAVADAERAVRASAAPAKRGPVWKRGWFWGVIGASVAVVAAVGIGVGVAATSPRDYVVNLR